MADYRLQRQSGVALLAAIILMLALSMAMVAVFYRHQLDVSMSARSFHGEQAMLLGLSAESWSAQLLSDQNDDRQVDHLNEVWTTYVPALPVESGFIEACLGDLQSRINLTSFSIYDNEAWNAEIQDGGNGLLTSWRQLLRILELPVQESMLGAVIDWTDEDDTPVNQWGAEQLDYEAQRSGLMVPNGPFSDTRELAAVRGYNSSMLLALEPFITALPVTTQININTARPELLEAMGGEYGARFREYVISNRPFADTQVFRSGLAGMLNLGEAQAQQLWSDQLVGVNSDYFVLFMQVSIGESRLVIESVLDRDNRDTPVVISRTIRTVPDAVPQAYIRQQAARVCHNLEVSS